MSGHWGGGGRDHGGLGQGEVSEAIPSGVGDPGPNPAATEALSELLPESMPTCPGCSACPAPAQ